MYKYLKMLLKYSSFFQLNICLRPIFFMYFNRNNYFIKFSTEIYVKKQKSSIKIDICCCLVYKSCVTLLQPHRLYSAGLLCPCDFPGKNTGVGCHFLLQGIFPTQVLNPCLLQLLHWQVNSLPPGSDLSHSVSVVTRSSFFF